MDFQDAVRIVRQHERERMTRANFVELFGEEPIDVLGPDWQQTIEQWEGYDEEIKPKVEKTHFKCEECNRWQDKEEEFYESDNWGMYCRTCRGDYDDSDIKYELKRDEK